MTMLIDYINSDGTVKDIRHCDTDDINACFRAIYSRMNELGVPRVRVHIDKLGRWVPAGIYTQEDMRGMFDEGR